MRRGDEETLRVEGVEFSYGSFFDLLEINISALRGEFLGIIGPNGSGKTTLLRIIAALLRPKRGVVMLEKEDVFSIPLEVLAKKLALVSAESTQEFNLTVADVIFMGRYPHSFPMSFWESEKDVAAVKRAMEETNVEHLSGRRITELSSGERQRVLIARALAQEPDVLLIDEPTSHLDLKYQVEIMSLLRKLTRTRGITVITAIHDLNLAGRYCDELILLCRGRILKVGKPQDVLKPELIEKAYGVKVVVRWEGGLRSPVVIPL